MKKYLLIIPLILGNINLSYAQTIPMENQGILGFHPLRGLFHHIVGAYRYNQAGRSVIEQNAELALQYYGISLEEFYLENIKNDLFRHVRL